jgi:hypothetical protein
MITRLVDSLEALAGIRIPDGEPAELAGEFADAFLLASDCRQLQLSREQLEALQQVDTMLAERDSSAIRDPDVRAAARRALQALQT